MRPIMALKSASGKPGHGDQGAHGVAQSAEGHRRGVGDQAKQRGLKRREAQADHHGAADRHGRAAAARAFQQRAEGEGDQQHLQAAVGARCPPIDCLMISNCLVSTEMS